MSFSDGGNIASGASTANNQANLTVATTVAVSAGDLVVVAVVVDNQNATGGDQGDVSGVTIGGVALTKGRQTSPALTAQTAVATSLWYGQPGAISSGQNIIATFANAATSDASALSARKFTVPSGATVTLAGTNATTSTTTNPGSLDFTGANVAHLRIRAIGCEFDTTQALTVTGSWTAWTEAGSAATGTATEAVIEVEHRIVTGTTGASAPTLGSACDSSSVYLAFTEATQGTLTIAGSSTVAWVGQAVLPPAEPDHPSFTLHNTVIFERTILYPTIFEPPLDRVYKSGTLTIGGSTSVAWIGAEAAAPPVPTMSVQTETTVRFDRTLLYESEIAPITPLENVQSGVLAIAGSTTVAWIGSRVLAGTFSTAGSTTVAWTGRGIAATTLTISGSTTVAWNGVTVTVGTFSISMSSTISWIGQATAQGTLSVSLGTAVAWIGASISTGAGTWIVQGSTDVVWVGRSTAQGTLSIAGSTTVAWNGSALIPTTLTIGNSTTVAWVGRATAQGTLTIAGSTTIAWIGSAVKPATLSITTGTTNVQWTGQAIAQSTWTVSLGTAVAWIGVASAAGSGTMVVSGSTTVAWTGRAIARGTLSISGSTTASFIGVSIARATLSIAGSTTVSWVGQSIRAAFAVMAGSTTVSWIGSAVVTPNLLSIAGSTDVTWIGVGLERRSGQFAISGSTDVVWIGMGALPPEPGTFSIEGSTEIAWVGENATVFVPPSEGYESQVGVWHVHYIPRGSKNRWSGRTGKRYRIYGTIPEAPLPTGPLWILDDGYWHDGGVWIDTEVWED